MIINKEHFEAWLFSRPDEETYNYQDPSDCLICRFLKSKGCISPSVGPDYFRHGEYGSSDRKPLLFPQWLTKLECRFRMLTTIGEVKSAWLKLWPETDVDISAVNQIEQLKE